MGEVTRAEMEAVHGRISDLKQRVTVLETDLPHIRRTVEKIDGSITWAVRIILGAILAGFIAFVLRGGLNPPAPAQQPPSVNVR